MLVCAPGDGECRGQGEPSAHPPTPLLRYRAAHRGEGRCSISIPRGRTSREAGSFDPMRASSRSSRSCAAALQRSRGRQKHQAAWAQRKARSRGDTHAVVVPAALAIAPARIAPLAGSPAPHRNHQVPAGLVGRGLVAGWLALTAAEGMQSAASDVGATETNPSRALDWRPERANGDVPACVRNNACAVTRARTGF